MKRKITNTYTNSTSDMKNKKKRILNIVSLKFTPILVKKNQLDS